MKIGGEFVISMMDNNEDFGKVAKHSHFFKHSLMIIFGEYRIMCRGPQSPHEVSHEARRDNNFSNSFTFDLKSDTNVDFFAEEFWRFSSYTSSEDPTKKLWTASIMSLMDLKGAIIVGKICLKSYNNFQKKMGALQFPQETTNYINCGVDITRNCKIKTAFPIINVLISNNLLIASQ